MSTSEYATEPEATYVVPARTVFLHALFTFYFAAAPKDEEEPSS